MRHRFTGSPDPETAAAILACVEAALATTTGPPVVRIPAWRQAAIRENVAPPRRAESGATWRAQFATH